MPVAACLMANHPQPREHDVGHDQDEDDLQSPISSPVRSASTPAAATVAASTPAPSVSSMSAVSAPNTTSAAVHHNEIARMPGRRRAGATYEFPEDGHARMQTAAARALYPPWFKPRHHPIGIWHPSSRTASERTTAPMLDDVYAIGGA